MNGERARDDRVEYRSEDRDKWETVARANGSHKMSHVVYLVFNILLAAALLRA